VLDIPHGDRDMRGGDGMDKETEKKVSGSMMVVGGGIAGIQTALDLANSGFFVYLVEKSPAIGGIMSQLDKTFPTNDCSMCIISPKLVEVNRHLNIGLLTNSDLLAVEGKPGRFRARVLKRPRYIDQSKCTSCGECAKVCPISISNEFDQGLSTRKAAFKKYPQASPTAYAITKRGTAPCKATCPAHVSIQGYIALIKEGKYREALELFKDAHPFPGICGRVCHHPCEGVCTRKDLDEPVAIRYLHRFLADTDASLAEHYRPSVAEEKDKSVAIIGSGPAGLSAAYFLRRRGYRVTVYEKLPVAGGMMAVGIPEYRLPRDVLGQEVETIRSMGVEIVTGKEFGRDISLEDLWKTGFSAVLIATGLHLSRRLGVPGEDLEGVLKGVEFLRAAALGTFDLPLGKTIVIGGGNVAIDAARTALRKGAEEVTAVCLEKREEMPAWDYEIAEASEEGIRIVNSLGPRRFLDQAERLAGVEFKRCTRVFDEKGAFNPGYDEKDLTVMSADTVIVAIGQAADLNFAEPNDIAAKAGRGLAADPLTFESPVKGVFAAGDAVYGPRSVVEAVEAGKEAAESIHRYIAGEDLKAGRERQWDFEKPDTTNEKNMPRTPMPVADSHERRKDFREVELGFEERDALEETTRCLRCGICSECYQCVKACLAGAVDHEQKEQEVNVDVGAVILCPGAQTYDPTPIGDLYGYGKIPNVVTSIEFERILSASGPFMGHLVRPSDHKEPAKIAWIQCVGSRDVNRSGNGYCSYMCCMYAIKEAVIAKEHSKAPLDTAIFFMDMRTFGKDYEKYYTRAKEEHKVRFIRSRIHTVQNVEGSEDILIRYVDHKGNLSEEVFDMVVLSVGIKPSSGTLEMCERLGIGIRSDGFALTNGLAPVETTRQGIYVCGSFQSPKDIPSSVTDGSAAACSASMICSGARWTETRSLPLPDEKDVSNLEPRVGVFVCNCGINIRGVVDVPEVTAYVATLPNVVFSDHNLFTCSQDTQEIIKKKIIEHDLNRVVVASCSPRTHEPLFMETLQACGLNKYLFEMANIRDQCSWVHGSMPEDATDKAKDLVRMAVSRAALLKPLKESRISVVKRALVVGGGIAGMNAALGLADQGYEAVLIEKEASLGGFSANLTKTLEGEDIKAYVESLKRSVTGNPRIQVLTNALIVQFSGVQGSFTTEVLVGPGMYERKISHGIVVIATGANEYEPKEYLYGKDPKVITQTQLARRLEEQGGSGLDRVVMIQCVGSRNDENPNCSRICCQSALKNALHIKDRNPNAQVIVLYRDMRAYGLMEYAYTEARQRGVIFSKFEKDAPPKVSSAAGSLKVFFNDPVLGMEVEVEPDLLVLSAGMRPSDTEELAGMLKVPRNAEGYFLEAHVKLRPVDMASDGIFVCGTAHGPKLISETISQARAAASRAATFLAKDFITLSGVVARVDPEHCAACLICVRSCPYGAPRINEDGVSEIDPALCHGCGVCVSECPAKTISLEWYEDDQIMCKLEALFEARSA